MVDVFLIFYKGHDFCDFLFGFFSEKGSTLKGKNLFSLAANSLSLL